MWHQNFDLWDLETYLGVQDFKRNRFHIKILNSDMYKIDLT